MSAEDVSPTRWREALATFERLQDLDAARREADLSALRDRAPELHALVLTLIEADARAEDEDYLAKGAAPVPAHGGTAGVTVGPYRLERSLGEGGMGTVWLARRADGVFETPVALKLLHGHLSLSGSARERFVREGRILGELAHPNIARLLDAGVAPEGQLYLALEYVEGGRLDRFCDDRRLPIDARLKLVQQVCAALAHAHARLVVHRDVKPSNILVTQEGEVKLLDFGIAKLVEHQTGSEVTELTHLGGRVLTPEFAAPEQVLGGTITVATDVYALGVLLYVLLGGWRPYGPRGAAPTQIERAVLETEPPPLSRARPLGDDDPTPLEVAARRSTTPSKLAEALRGDLEVIVGRALKKNPEERYPTVAALAEDLRRYLVHEPVMARPDTATYRARKFLRRHRVAVSAAFAVALAVLGGSGVALWQAERARAEALKADAVKEFILGIFSMNSLEGDSPAAARQTTVEQLLKLGTDRVAGEFEGQPVVKAELLGVLGSLNQGLGRDEEALALGEERLQVMQRLGAGAAERAEVLIGMAESETRLEAYGDARHRLDEAQALLESAGGNESLAQAKLLLASASLGVVTLAKTDPAPLGEARRALELLERHHPGAVEHVKALYLVGVCTYNTGNEKAARDIVRRGLALAREKHPRKKWLAGEGAATLSEVASYRDWIPVAREAVGIVREVYGPDHPRTAAAEIDLGNSLYRTRSSEELGEAERLVAAAEGLALIEGAAAKIAKTLPEDREESLDARMVLGTLYMLDARLQEALPLLKGVADLWAAKQRDTNGSATAQFRLGTLYLQLGRYEAAEECLRRAIEVRTRLRGPRHNFTTQARYKYGEMLHGAGRNAEALQVLTEVRHLQADDNDVVPDGVYVIDTEQAAVLNDLGRAAEAASLATDVIERLRATGNESRGLMSAVLYEAGRAQRLQGDPAAAVPSLREAVRLGELVEAERSPYLAVIRAELARALWLTGEREEARKLLLVAETTLRVHPELGEHYRAPVRAVRKLVGA